MAMYATISHKKKDDHEYVVIFKSRNAAIRSAKLDIRDYDYIDSEAYMIAGIDDIGYIRSDFTPYNIKRYGIKIATFKEVGH